MNGTYAKYPERTVTRQKSRSSAIALVVRKPRRARRSGVLTRGQNGLTVPCAVADALIAGNRDDPAPYSHDRSPVVGLGWRPLLLERKTGSPDRLRGDPPYRGHQEKVANHHSRHRTRRHARPMVIARLEQHSTTIRLLSYRDYCCWG